MYKIETKRKLAPTINLFTFSAEEVAAKAKPGQFVIIRLDEDGERIPLTIANVDKEQGTISVACHEVGKTTAQLGSLKEGDAIPNLLGPLGKPAAIENSEQYFALAAELWQLQYTSPKPCERQVITLSA